MAHAHVNNIDMHYAIHGDGPEWLVLIGGYVSAYAESWQRWLPALTEHFRVLAFDSRGSGRSSSPDEPYSTVMMAADTVALMDHIGVERAHFVGRSLGGCIAQVIALDQPQRVASLAMTSTFARLGPRGHVIVRQWMEIARSQGFEPFFEFLMTYFYTEEFYATHGREVDGYVKSLAEVPRTLHGFLNAGHAVLHHDVWDRLDRITCPVLLMCGEEDVITPARHTEAMAQRLPDARVYIAAKSAHGFLAELPASQSVLLEFLASVSRGRATAAV